MSSPIKKSTVYLFAFALLSIITVASVRTYLPANKVISTPRIKSLRDDAARLAASTPVKRDELEGRRSFQEKQLWTETTFDAFRKSLPQSWKVLDLGPTESKTATAHRYSFQYINPAEKNWEDICSLLRLLEAQESLTIDTISMRSNPSNTKTFQEIMYITTFYFIPEPKK